jgi:putative methionine-R-sulfoxide reductase with GAF domain
LLILDNADKLAVDEFIPSGKNGHLILTTQTRAMNRVARIVEIQKMGTEEGGLFLLRRTNYIADNAPFESASTTDQSKAKAIAKQLHGLPLAIDQAGAYIEETGCRLSGYLDLYRSHTLELLQHRGEMTHDHPEPVATTWAISFEQIEKASSAAAELLRFCAFLPPDGIPEEVFSKGAQELGPLLEPVASDAFALNSAIAEILKYSLLRRDPNAKNLEINRLVQAVLQQSMDEATRRQWEERALRALRRACPKVGYSTLAHCALLLPHTNTLLRSIMSESLPINGSKEEIYSTLLQQIEAVIGGTDDLIANLANVAAILKQAFKHFHWVGFYRTTAPNLLTLGPFQGPPACVLIPFEQGVCGTSARTQKTVLVPDVKQFPGHIACSTKSKSEIVVPLVHNGHTQLVLDIDSDEFNAFDQIDQHYLELIVATIAKDNERELQ